MISDLRAIAALGVMALVLLVSLLGGSPAQPPRRVVMPAFAPAAVRTLSWSRPDSSLPVSLRSDGAHWRGAENLPVDTHYLADLFSSLRSARWHRRDSAAHHAFRRTLAIRSDKATISIDLGEQLEGTAQIWLRVDHGNEVVLVDGWLAKFLDPAPIDPYERFPFETAASEPTIRSGQPPDGLELRTHPWRDAHGLVAPKLGEALVSALARIEYVALANGPTATPNQLELGTAVFLFGGTCPGTALVALRAPVAQHAGCIDPAAWRDVTTAIAELTRSVDDTMDDRPAGFAIDHLELPGGTLRLVKRPTITIAGVTHPADPDRVAELLHVLGQATSRAVPVATAVAELTILITPLVGPPVELELFAGSVQRRGEPRGVPIGSADHGILSRPAAAYVDSERWGEEPSTISELTLDRVSYRRGAVIGEWTRVPAGAFDPSLVEILATAAAKLDAPATRGRFRALHTLQLRFAPPVGTPVTRELAIGGVEASNGGCAGQLDGERISLPAVLCTAVEAVAAH
ncbi:hypothetical protein BH11MYX1_BH11MYX1_52430 [soil metagenome]